MAITNLFNSVIVISLHDRLTRRNIGRMDRWQLKAFNKTSLLKQEHYVA